MKSEVIDLTPELASRFLETNVIHNRPLVPSHVRRLSDQMSKGFWKLTHQGIAFDNNGNLTDGQHRCHAVATSGVTIKILATYGCDEDSYLALDQGKGRTIADVLSLPKRYVEPCTFIARFVIGGNVTPQMAKPYVDRFITDSEILHDHCGTSRKRLTTAPIKAAAILAMNINREYAMNQYRAIALTSFEEMTPVVGVLFRQLITTSSGDGSMQRVFFAKAFHAFNRENKDITYLGFKNIESRLDEIKKFINKLETK